MFRARWAAIAALSTTLAVGVQAQQVTYSTTASQLCVGSAGCGVASQTIGGGTGVTLTFMGIASSTVNANPTTFGSFGELVMACVGGGTACGSQSLAGLNLYLNISQTLPTVGSGSISGGVMSGFLSGTASSATITWSVPNGINIGDITYSVLNNPLGLVPPAVNGGVTSVQAFITNRATVVPEPSTYALMSAGLIALFGIARQRKNRA